MELVYKIIEIVLYVALFAALVVFGYAAFELILCFFSLCFDNVTGGYAGFEWFLNH